MPTLPSNYDETDQLAANTLRMLAVDAVQAANSGHPGLPLGVADMVTVLWTRFLKHNPADPLWPDRDRFILSAGHGSALLYSLLHTFGYPLSMEELQNFRQFGYVTAGHPEIEPERGIEITTGPLGQGISNAVGFALAECMLAERFNKPQFPIVDHYTYVVASDGDLMEGVSHEAASFAGHLGLGKLIVLYDDNNISIDGSTDLSLSDNAMQRFDSYGWHTQAVDGHDMAAVDAAIRSAQAETTKPSIIACKTQIGFGSPLVGTSKVHGSPLGPDGVRQTKESLGMPADESFYIPAEAAERFGIVRSIGAAEEAEWDLLLSAYRQAYPELAVQWDQFVAGELPAGWEAYLPDFTGDKAIATRATSGKVLDALVPQIPTLIGGSADLSPSNNTRAKGAVEIKPGDFSGSYIHYGVREHGMGAIMNGMAAHGFRPFGGTFLVFADYMRGAIRVAALMGLPVTYVFTHDSIGLGEDGPTHQPVEHILSLRSIPNLVVIRPADGNETSQAWKVALDRSDGPTALILSRQGLPQVSPVDNGTALGAYVLVDPADGDPDIVLIGTGSELALALAAVEPLAEKGIAARVISMPSWELFDAQTDEYRESVLLPGIPRLAIEAGSTLAWARYVGDQGAVIGLDHFGASGPAKTVFDAFGFTVDNVVEQACNLV